VHAASGAKVKIVTKLQTDAPNPTLDSTETNGMKWPLNCFTVNGGSFVFFNSVH
jgi:hypothetical protein